MGPFFFRTQGHPDRMTAACDLRAPSRYYGQLLSSCAPVDAAVTCGSTGVCAALHEKTRRKNAEAKESVTDVTRCLYRPEGGRPALLCDAVDQWPEFAFGELNTWADTVYSSAECIPKQDQGKEATGPGKTEA